MDRKYGIGRVWERDRLQLELGSHNPQGNSSTSANIPPPTRYVGRKYKHDSVPISFVFGEKFDQQMRNIPEASNQQANSFKAESQQSVDKIVKPEPSDEEANIQSGSNIARPRGKYVALEANKYKCKIEASNGHELNNVNWISSSDRGQVLLQMMEKMGYEQGKGLGRSGQGIVEPIKPNPNPGKKTLGAEPTINKGSRGGWRRHLKKREHEQTNGEEFDGPNLSNPTHRGAGQMHIQDNVQNSLREAGFTEHSVDEIWHAISVLANHKIMPLGQGLGFVKRMVGKRRRFERQNDE